MIVPILKYGHPALRQKGRPVIRVNPPIRELIKNMLETMYDARGVGLAAQQVGQALALSVIDVRGAVDRPSTLELEGKSADIQAFMPLVLINPAITPVGQPVAGLEGCLSFPELYGQVTRPESVDVQALNEKMEPLKFRCGGLLARAVQHEVDHLQGILFIDRMEREEKKNLKTQLEELHQATKKSLGQK